MVMFLCNRTVAETKGAIEMGCWVVVATVLILRLVRDSHSLLHSIYVPESKGSFSGRTPTGMA